MKPKNHAPELKKGEGTRVQAHRQTSFLLLQELSLSKQPRILPQLKSKIGNILVKATARRINLNIHDALIASR